jgi:uncharacterized protein involved in type VI secretion and phage assembly
MNAIEAIKKIAEEESKKLNILELGVVTSIFPHKSTGDKDNYEVNVKLKNRDLELRKVPVATSHVGLAHIPNIGDLVLLSFIHGNINAPVIMARLFSDEHRPPLNDAGEIIYDSPDPKKSGLKRLYLKFKSGVELTITDDEVKVEAGKSVLTMQNNGDVVLDSNARVEIKAKGDMALSAQNISIKSQQSLDLHAGTTGKIEASATLDIKGAMVKIN